MILGIFAAIVAAFGYGTASLLQAHGASRVSAGGEPTATPGAGGAPTVASTIATVLTVSYLAGLCLDGLGFIGNLVAARELPLFLAQPIVSANLIVTAVGAVLFLGARLTPREWTAIAVVVGALVLLGFASGPEGHGHDDPWLHWTVLVVGIVLVIGGVVAMRLTPPGRWVAVSAGLLGGVLFGILAVAVRILDGLDPFHPTTLLSDPACYALLICGVGGFYMFTVALQTGSVAAASASLVVGETVVPGVVGIVLLGDQVRDGWGPVAVIAFTAAVIGAVVVATSSAVESVEVASG
ncbi:hypothetical protein QSJ18_12820 [Gordonia sp. ABSL1-1]|uniref:hypothetical protein n=1 Tax=Gordonia sp. ABSL1-1 TaxID=3053923 RepID=UPI00257413C2|nr:hypothetical protein [Gordonia sp. ABSL1-1]MDL9937631.1 hypothetical protein [Gordonia sp. ABSL1-1]